MPNLCAARIVGLTVLVATLAACTSSGSQAPATRNTATSPTPSAGSTSAPPSSSAPRSSTTASVTPSSTPSTKPATGDGVLVDKADAVCATGNAYRRAHPLPVRKFDPTNPAVQDLPKVAAYLKHEPDVIARLLRLDLPFGVATALTQEKKNEKAQIAAAANSDPQSFAHAAQDAQVVVASLLTAAKRAGLASAKACSTYFRG